MPFQDLQVPARYYVWVVQTLTAEGMDLSSLIAGLKLPANLLADPDASLPLAKVDRLVQELVALGVRSDIGFDIGRQISATAHSFVGFGMLNSASLDQALRFEARFFRLVLPSFTMRYQLNAQGAALEFRPRVAMSRECLNFHLEAIGTAALRELSDLTNGQRPPCRLQHSMLEPPHAQRYKRDLDHVAVMFSMQSQPSVRVQILRDPRTIHLALANEHAAKVAEQRCRSLVQRAAAKGGFADWVAMTLREVSDELPKLAELAANLSISPRSLNRYLAREGTSFRTLAGQIQHQLACERLTHAGMSPSQVAYSLGFSDQSAFSKAFRSKQGCSPGEYQRDWHLRAGQSSEQ